MLCVMIVALIPLLRQGGALLTGRWMRNRRPHLVYWSLKTIHLPSLVGAWPLERISYLLRRRRIMATKKRMCLLLTALLSLSGVQPVTATDYQASDYLPLAVGNSWTYTHEYYVAGDGGRAVQQYSAYAAQLPQAIGEPFLLPEFTISVLNTEVIDGKMYYVISDMPANWPPAPPHFIASKKLRWEGTHLMERTADGERSVFRFDGANEAGYTVETDQADQGKNLLVKVRAPLEVEVAPVNFYDFRFYLPPPWFVPYESQGCGFTENYGNIVCGRTINAGPDTRSSGAGKQMSGSTTFHNRVVTLHAVLGGRTVVYKDLLTPTSTPPSSWGQVKEEVQ